jgi:DNA-binding HxlR family transcriptional regulator
MERRSGYGQYCPLAMSAEILCNRWTVLIIRELLEGSTGFNEIRRGVPLISRTLLSTRIKELERAGLITRSTLPYGNKANYQLTAAGEALGPAIFSLADWGQRWIDVEPSVEMVDTDFLMWDIRRNVRFLDFFPEQFVVQFHFWDAPKKKDRHWLVFQNAEVDLCYRDPGFEIDVVIEAGMKTMVKVWMGWMDFNTALSSGELRLLGPKKFTQSARKWLGLSSFSHIEKHPIASRVLRSSAPSGIA